jgi:hypothetical protein
MMRGIIFGIIFAAFVAPALAADDEPAAKPVHHRPAPPRPVRDLHVAAIQAPPPKPRETPSSSGKLSQSAAQQNPAQVLQAFTLADLQAALADAQAQNPPDTIAANCYAELITVVQSPAINPLPAGPGAFQLFQKARDLKALADSLQSRNGPLAQLQVACAPLVVDVQTLLIRLGVIGGAIAGGL